MLEVYLRKSIDAVCFDPIANFLYRRTSLSAMHITGLAGGIGTLVIPLVWTDSVYLAVLVLFFSGFLDVLDGALARISGTSSMQGAAADIMTDRWVEACVFIALLGVDPGGRAWACLAMSLSVLLCVTSFLVVGIFEKNHSHKSFYYSPGLMERCEAFIFFIAMILMPNLFTPLAWGFTVLVLWTSVIRLREFLQQSLA